MYCTLCFSLVPRLLVTVAGYLSARVLLLLHRKTSLLIVIVRLIDSGLTQQSRVFFRE